MMHKVREILITREASDSPLHVVTSDPITIVWIGHSPFGNSFQDRATTTEFRIGVAGYHIGDLFKDTCCFSSGEVFIFYDELGNTKIVPESDIGFFPSLVGEALLDIYDATLGVERFVETDDEEFWGAAAKGDEEKLKKLLKKYRQDGYTYIELRAPDPDWLGVYNGTGAYVKHRSKFVVLYRPGGSKSFLTDERLKKRVMELVK